MGKERDVDGDAEPALQSDTQPAVKQEELKPLPSNEALAEDSHQSTVHFDNAGNEVSDMWTDTDNLPDMDMDRFLRVTFGNEL